MLCYNQLKKKVASMNPRLIYALMDIKSFAFKKSYIELTDLTDKWFN